MAASVLMERSASAALPMGSPGTGFQPGAFPGGSPAAANWCVVPRCTLKFEKTKEGCKIYCNCDDEVACGTLQNLCRMLCEGMCSCCCTCNGIQVCQCNLTMGLCKCEYTKDGCCITCTSGDKACCAMIQSCCDCLSHCCESGCCCYICFNNTPICCGVC